jgi:serine/threonine protein kinase
MCVRPIRSLVRSTSLRAKDEGPSVDDELTGSPDYMAPETLRGSTYTFSVD